MSIIPRWSQNDSRWSRLRLGESVLTIGSHGCLLLCLSMATNTTPDKLVKMLEFTQDGLILWNDKNKKALHDIGIDFAERYRRFDENDFENLKKFCTDKNYAPVLEVRTRNGGNHWVLPFGRSLTWRGAGWETNDPWTGRREHKTTGFGAPYLNGTGWLLFSRVLNV